MRKLYSPAMVPVEESENVKVKRRQNLNNVSPDTMSTISGEDLLRHTTL